MKYRAMLGLSAAIATLPLMLANMPAAADDGISDDKIVFGQAAAMEGPAMALGTGMRTGIMAAFEEANRAGGVKGRKLELISYDDGYEPQRSISLVRKLINEDKVFGLIGPVGTPTAAATQPLATAAQVPFVGPFTGAGFLRNSKLGNVVNVRASYDAETEVWIQHLTETLGMTRIAILYQDDGFGRVGLSGVKKALDARRMELVAEGTYERNTVAVKTALIELRKAKPQAVVMVGAYKPIATFIKLAKLIDFDPVFINISFVGSNALAQELGGDGNGVIVSQVVPFPWDDSLPLVKSYQESLKALDAKEEPGFVSLEGYITGRMAIMALEKVDGELTREKFLNAIWSTGNFDLGGVTLSYGPDDNQGMDKVFLTRIRPDGGFEPVGKPAS